MQPNADQLLFAHVVDRPNDEVDLAVAALMVAELEYDGLDVAHYVDAIDEMAERVRVQLHSDASEVDRVRRVSRTLFEELGYEGNSSDYYDPKNSFLNQVIERKTGIPITLAVLWMEIGRRVGLEVGGLNFPGHFLVRVEADDGFVVVDPFHGGLTVTIDELNARLRAVLGPDAELAAEHLEPADKRSIVSRMLGNLSAIYRRDNDVDRAIAVLERQLVLEPANLRLKTELEELRRRAVP